MPLLARDVLGGGASLYGIMLGAFGLGAVIGALNVSTVRRKFEAEALGARLLAHHGRRRLPSQH